MNYVLLEAIVGDLVSNKMAPIGQQLTKGHKTEQSFIKHANWQLRILIWFCARNYRSISWG